MLNIGMKAECTVVVNDTNTAATVGSGSLPVFATPALAALVEKTACLVLEGGLESGQTTVGTVINVKHLAPTPVGMEVKCICTLTELEGRKIVFTAEVYDKVGMVGEVYHERFIVKAEPFTAKANARGEGVE